MNRNAWVLAAILAGAGFASAQDGGEKFLVRGGAGFGAGFGGLMGGGVEVEYHRMALLANVGYWDEPTFEVGARYFFAAPGKRLRPHVTATFAPTHQITYATVEYDEDLDEYYLGDDKKALIYGLNVLGGLDYDFGAPGGFMMTGGLGVAIPGSVPQSVKDDYDDADLSPPEADVAITFSLGAKYQF
jgi:hypothetical protein